MTRINAGIRPNELPNKLLLAEHREIVRIPNVVSSGRARLDLPFPKRFTLGKGHVRFFYTRLAYIHRRYNALHKRCLIRGLNVSDFSDAFDDVPEDCYNDWQPTKSARQLIIDRIRSKGFELRKV